MSVDIRFENAIVSFRDGDADLYLSSETSEPTFDFLSHAASSVTCGLDQIDVPRDVPRPVHVAVYGHPKHEVG